MGSILQQDVIDVAEWPTDELFYNYPEGARSKTAVFRPDALTLPFIKAKRRYLYKRSDKRYPEQFWGEIVAYHIGGLLGVTVPPAFAALNSREGDCAALIEWFYEDDKAVFDPGGVFMQREIPEFDRKRGLQHNFETVQKIGAKFDEYELLDVPWEVSWGDAFLFDALIGNTDRHQDNWGCMYQRRNRILRAVFAPLFDNGTSLGNERWPDKLRHWSEERFARYVAEGKHHMKWKADDPESCGHVAMVEKIVEAFPHLKDGMVEKITNFDLEQFVAILEQLTSLKLPTSLTVERKDLYIRLIALRQRNLKLALT